MATVTHAGTTSTTTAGDKTVAATPAIGDLIVVVCNATGVNTTAVADNNADGLGTYTKVDVDRTGFSTAGTLNVWIRNSLVGSATSTTYTATQTTSTGGGLSVFSVAGMTRTGALAVRSSGGQSTGTAVTTPAPVLSLTPDTANPIIAAVANGTSSSTTVTERTGYTEATDLGFINPPTGFETCFLNSGETSATLTFGSTTATTFASIAVELDTTAIISPTIRQQIDNGASGTALMSLTLSLAQVGDTVVVLHADNFHTAADLTTPTGTAVGGGWSLKHTLDGGASDNHCKVWMGTVTTAGGTVVEGNNFTDSERYLGAWVLVGTVVFDTAASTDSDASSVTHVAPSVTPTTGMADDLLICLFGTGVVTVNYTMPGGNMTARTERDTATFGTYRAGDEPLTSNAATGTRTATASATDTWFAVSVLIQDFVAASGGVRFITPGRTWKRRFKHRQILPVGPTGATTQQFTQPLNATLSFTSSQNTATSKGISAALSFTGSQARRISTTLSAATLSFTGAVTKRTATVRSATLSFTGSHATAVVHLFTQALNASLSFTSNQTRSIGTHLAGALSFTSSQTKQVGKLISAALLFTALQTRAIKTNLAGTLSFTGSVTKRTAKNLGTATLSFTGSVATLAVHVFSQAFNATLSFTSSQTRSVRKGLSATLSFTGSLPRQTAKGISAALSFTSSQTRRTSTNLAGALSFTSTQTRRTAKNLGTATLSFTGSLATLAVHVFTQAFNATLSFTGSLTTHRIVTKAFSATLSFTGSQTKRTAKGLVAGLSFTGSQTKRIAKTISAALGFTALLDRLSSAQPTSGTASVAPMAVPEALRGSGTAPTSEAGDSTGPTSSAP